MSRTTSARCSKWSSPTSSGASAISIRCWKSSTSPACARRRRSRCRAAIAVGDIQTLVRHLTDRGIGVLITDHNVRETLGLTDRAYIIYSGEVLMEGRPDEIVNNPDVRRLYLGEEFRL